MISKLPSAANTKNKSISVKTAKPKVGWIYGSVTEDILSGFKMQCHGWRSVYSMPKRPAFKGSALINLSDRLHQVLCWVLGSVEILLSRHCQIWYAYNSGLKPLERFSYIASVVYPLTSIPLLVYCTLPVACLLTGKFIVPEISSYASILFMALFISIVATSILKVQWGLVPECLIDYLLRLADMDDLATHPMELDSIDLELDSIDLEILSPTMKVIRHCSHLPFGLTAPSLHSGLVDEDLSLFTASSHCGLVEGPFQLMLFLTVHRMVLDGFFLSTAETDRDYAIGYKTMFSDQHPFLLISQESLDALNQKLKEPMHINRFRPNILVEGGGPFCEDLWKEIKINKFTFYGVKLCARCKVPTISQETILLCFLEAYKSTYLHTLQSKLQ